MKYIYTIKVTIEVNVIALNEYDALDQIAQDYDYKDAEVVEIEEYEEDKEYED